MKTTLKRIGAALLALLTVTALLPGALAKEETIYATLDSQGDVSSVFVVNSFPRGGTIVDYGDYSSVRNMIGAQTLQLTDGTVTAETAGTPLTYEGRLSSADLPWLFTLRYTLDGQPIAAADLAGKNGHLQLELEIRRNPVVDSEFYTQYTLQVTVLLDTNRCTDIDAAGATLANVGDNRRMTYTILPNQETTLAIFADVTDFQMPGIIINGVYLEMSFNLAGGSLGQLGASLSELQKSVATINAAAQTAKTSIFSVNTGINTIAAQAEPLNTQLIDMTNGITAAFGSVTALAGSLDALTQQNETLTDKGWQIFVDTIGIVQKQINTMLTHAGLSTVTLTRDGFAAQLTSIQQQLNNLGVEGDHNTLIPLFSEQLTTIRTYYDALQAYTEGVARASGGVAPLHTSMSELQNSFKPFSDSLLATFNAINGIKTDMNKINDDAAIMASATESLYSQTNGIMDSVTSLVQDALGDALGGDYTPVSFASARNTQVELVQFVIQTPEIKVVKTAAAVEEPVNKTFWQRLLDLF